MIPHCPYKFTQRASSYTHTAPQPDQPPGPPRGIGYRLSPTAVAKSTSVWSALVPHFVHASACPAAAYVPGPHKLHSFACPAVEYLPAGQDVHASACPAAENEPASHCVHSPSPTAEYVPAGQVVHEPAPAAAYVPAGQDVHEPAAAPAYVPASHGVHSSAPSAEYVPAEHVSQSQCVAAYSPAAHVTLLRELQPLRGTDTVSGVARGRGKLILHTASHDVSSRRR